MKRDLDAVLVASVAILAYVSNLANGFVYDDRFIIERNPLVQSLDWWGLLTTSYWGELVNAGLFRPLTLLSFGLNQAVSGDAMGFHAVNDALHAGTSVLSLFAARALGASRFAALATGLVFGLHPLQTEAVTSLVGRADLLAFALVLGAFVLHIKGGHPYGVGALVFLGLCGKESAAFALTLFAIHYVLFERRSPIPIVSGAAAYLALRVAVLGSMGISGREIGFLDNPAATAGIGTRILTGLALLSEYGSRIVWPRVLSADYSFDQIPIATSFDPRVAAGALIVAGLVAVSIKGRGLPAFAALGFLLPTALVVHLLFPVGTIFAERLAYVPMFGASLLLALAMSRLGRYRAWALAVLLVVFAGRVVVRNRDWKDNETLFRRTVETSPRSARAHFLLGAELLEQLRYPEAAAAFALGLEIYPQHVGARMSLGQALLASDDPEGAADIFRHAFTQAPSDEIRALAIEASLAAGRSSARAGRWDQANERFEAVLELSPRHAEATNYLGLVAERREDLEGALEAYEAALSMAPDYVPALVNLASLRMRTGALGPAEALFRQAASLAPESYEAYNGLGIALGRQGRNVEAAAAFRRAIAIDPSLDAARDNLSALDEKP